MQGSRSLGVNLRSNLAHLCEVVRDEVKSEEKESCRREMQRCESYYGASVIYLCVRNFCVGGW